MGQLRLKPSTGFSVLSLVTPIHTSVRCFWSSRLTSSLENKQKENGITLTWDSLCVMIYIVDLGGKISILNNNIW